MTAKVSGFGYHQREVVEALRALGLDPDMVRRFVIDMRENWVPVLHVEMMGDPRIIELALLVMQNPVIAVEHCGPRPVIRLERSEVGGDARA